MAGNSGNAFLGFVLGALVVVVALIAIGMYSGNFGAGNRMQLSIDMPKPTIPTPR
jgi:hypothetical protein